MVLMAQQWSGAELPYQLLLVLMLLYIWEGASSNSLAYLSRIERETSDGSSYWQKLMRAPPEVAWKVTNYHVVPQRKVTKYSKSQRKVQTVTYERVDIVTSEYTEHLRIDAWTDETPSIQDLSRVDLRKFAMTKVLLTFEFDTMDRRAYETQLNRFRYDHRHDQKQNFTESIRVQGLDAPPQITTISDDVTYEQRVKKEQVGWVNNHHAAALVYTGKASWLASPWVFWLCHLLLPLALPYRMWLSASTGKCAVTIKKRIRCSLRQNPSERGEARGEESVSESLRQNPSERGEERGEESVSESEMMIMGTRKSALRPWARRVVSVYEWLGVCVYVCLMVVGSVGSVLQIWFPDAYSHVIDVIADAFIHVNAAAGELCARWTLSLSLSPLLIFSLSLSLLMIMLFIVLF
jgi:hypothetical protein